MSDEDADNKTDDKADILGKQCVFNMNPTNHIKLEKLGIYKDSYKVFFDFFQRHKRIKYTPKPYIECLPVVNYNYEEKLKQFKNRYVTVDHKTFKVLYQDFTYGLLNNLPKNCSYIHSGGSLHDILTHNFFSTTSLMSYTKLPYDLTRIIKMYYDENEEIIDLDIFLYSDSLEDKLQFIREYIITLMTQYTVYVTPKTSLVDIQILGVPRTVQLILSDEKSPIDIVSKFDCSHVMMYYQNNKLFMNKQCKKALKSQISHYMINDTNFDRRIYKIIKRNYKVSLVPLSIMNKNCQQFLSRDIDFEFLKKRFISYKNKEVHPFIKYTMVDATSNIPINKPDICVLPIETKTEQYDSDDSYHIEEHDENGTNFKHDTNLSDVEEKPTSSSDEDEKNTIILQSSNGPQSKIRRDYTQITVFALFKKMTQIHMLRESNSPQYFTTNDVYKSNFVKNIAFNHINEKPLHINNYISNKGDNVKNKTRLWSVYNIDLDSEKVFLVKDCKIRDVCIDIDTSYFIANMQLDPTSEFYKYVIFLEKKIKDLYVINNIKKMDKRIKCIKYFSLVDENFRIKIQANPRVRLKQHTTYNFLSMIPRLYINHSVGVFYWLCECDFVDRHIQYQYDLDTNVLDVISKIKTMKHCKRILQKRCKYEYYTPYDSVVEPMGYKYSKDMMLMYKLDL